MKCNHCLRNKNSVYQDYVFADKSSKPSFPGASINICWTCLDELNWTVEIKAIIHEVRRCNCGEYFKPKKSNSTKCSVCWAKYFQARRKNVK